MVPTPGVPSTTFIKFPLVFISKTRIGNSFSKPKWLDHANISFRNSKYYWKGVNAQPLSGFSYPSKVPLYFQGPHIDKTNDKFAPIINTTTSSSYSDILLSEWCSGLHAIN